MKPTAIVVAGPNGAGKTTFARPLMLRRLPDSFTFLNADLIAEAMTPFRPERSAVTAGKAFLQRLDDLVKRRQSFALESTLSGRCLAARLDRMRAEGYRIEMVFLWLPDPQLAVRRVAERVRRGGHSIPDEVVKRRFVRSYPRFCDTYRTLADVWTLLDGSVNPPVEVARGRGADWVEVVDAARWAILDGRDTKGESTLKEDSRVYPAMEQSYVSELGEVLEAMGDFLREQEALLARERTLSRMQSKEGRTTVDF